MRVVRRIFMAAAVSAIVGSAAAAEYTIDPVESIFAVVVHKAGVAARFAHNHLVFPKEYAAHLAADPAEPTKTTFSLSFPVTALQVDTHEAHTKWYPAIEKAGILDTPFSELDEGDRKVVAEHMLGEDQLDAKQFPTISATLTKVRAETKTQAKMTYSHVATIAFTVHGKTVERDCPASFSLVDGALTVDAVGAFTFTEFGIKPYSAMFGAVKNADTFHVLVHIAAKAKS